MSGEYSLADHYKQTDKLGCILTTTLFGVSLALAPWYGTWFEAILVGGGTCLSLWAIAYLAPGTVLSRASVGVAFMLMTALHIQQSHGLLELHFGVFVLLALLVYYRDWVPVVAAAGAIAVHHVLFYYLQTQGADTWVLQDGSSAWWIILLHAVYVVVEAAVVIYLAMRLKAESLASMALRSATERIFVDGKMDLSVRAQGHAPLSTKFNRFISDVEQLVSQVKLANTSIADVSDALVGITEDVHQKSQNLHQQTDTIESSIQQMESSVGLVSSNADEAAQSADSAMHSAGACRSSSESTENLMRSLSERLGVASKTIDDLDSTTKSIGGVLDVIRSIAEQTNLLALNAAIEAARAGEQGRGFAVVADEVRSLAKRTQESTEEIDKMIVALREESQDAVSLMNASKENATECVSSTHSNVHLMSEVADYIVGINGMNQRIADSANHQNDVTSEISKRLSGIAEVGDDTANNIYRIKAKTNELTDSVSQLSLLVERFRVGA